jgi:hypothetical protein
MIYIGSDSGRKNQSAGKGKIFHTVNVIKSSIIYLFYNRLVTIERLICFPFMHVLITIN